MMLYLLVFAQCLGDVPDLAARVAALEAQVASSTTVPGIYWADEWIPDGGDLADAVWAIQQDAGCGPLEGDGPAGRGRSGCRIQLSRGIYAVSAPITVCRQLVIEGISGGGGGAATRIETPGTTAFRIAPDGLCDALRPPSGAWTDGGNTSIRHLSIRDRSESTTSVGVHAEAPVHLADVYIRGFGQGVRVSADVNRDQPGVTSDGWPHGGRSNANRVSMERVHVVDSQGPGIYFDGGDSNAGYTLGVSVVRACKQATTECAGVHDSSFLGNTHIAPHAASNTQAWHYLTDSSNSRNVFVGAYGEGGELGLASSNDTVLGGIAKWDPAGNAVMLRDSTWNGFCVEDQRDGQNPYAGRVCFGSRASAAVALQASEPPFAIHRALRWKPVVDSAGRPFWRFDVANIDPALEVEVETSTVWNSEAGRVAMPTGAEADVCLP